MVEAKANWPELKEDGKPSCEDASPRSRENHERIGSAIAKACEGWRRIDPRVSISRDSRYQLANSLAFTWRLATLGFPVVLVYLGFTGDDGISKPFADDADWMDAFRQYTSGVVPSGLLKLQLEVHKNND